MKTAVIIFLTGLCIWILAPNLPTPADVFQSRPPSEIATPAHPAESPPTEKPIVYELKINFNLVERNLFSLINDEREKEGLHQLRWDENLHDISREHSEWMAATGNFKHSSYNVFENCWWGIGIYADNLAFSCFDSWKDSPRHYENLLEPSINYCAIGFAESDQGTFATFMAK